MFDTSLTSNDLLFMLQGAWVTLKLTAGHAHDGRSADDMLGTIGSGQTLLADAA